MSKLIVIESLENILKADNEIVDEDNLIELAKKTFLNVHETENYNKTHLFLEIISEHMKNEFDLIFFKKLNISFYLKNHQLNISRNYILDILQYAPIEEAKPHFFELLELYYINPVNIKIPKIIENIIKNENGYFKNLKNKERMHFLSYFVKYRFSLKTLNEPINLISFFSPEHFNTNENDKNIISGVYPATIAEYSLLYINLLKVISKFYLQNHNMIKDAQILNQILDKIVWNVGTNHMNFEILENLVAGDKILFIKNRCTSLTYDKIDYNLINNFSIESCSTIKNIIDGCSHVLQDYLKNFIVFIISKYSENQKEQYFGILLSIFKTVGFSYFYNVLTSVKEVNIKTFKAILSKGVNVDLSFISEFITNEKDKDFVFDIFPSITKLCTNKLNFEDNFFEQISHYINNYDQKIALGLTNMLESHLKNINSTCVLFVNISKEESKHLLTKYSQTEFPHIFISKYIQTRKDIFKNIVEITVRIIKNPIKCFQLDEIYDILRTHDFNEKYQYDGYSKTLSLCSSYQDILAIAEIFIRFENVDIQLSSKILNMCKMNNVKQQKVAYKLIYQLAKFKKLRTCICYNLLSIDYDCIFSCSRKYRILALFKLYDNCYNCKETEDFFKKIMMEYVISLKANSAKARQTCQNIFDEVINKKTYQNALLIALSGLDSIDYRIINGSVMFLTLFIQNKEDYYLRNKEYILDRARTLQLKGRECHKDIINLFTSIVNQSDTDQILTDEFVERITTIADISNGKTKKFMKKIITNLKKNPNVKFNSTLKKIQGLKFNHSNNVKFNVTKKGNIEVKKSKMKEDNDSS